MNEKVRAILSNILYIAFVLLLSFLIVRYVGQRTEVIGSSMVPTLKDGNQLITDKITYRFREPERFEIIVFPQRFWKKITATGRHGRRNLPHRSFWGKTSILSSETTGR